MIYRTFLFIAINLISLPLANADFVLLGIGSGNPNNSVDQLVTLNTLSGTPTFAGYWPVAQSVRSIAYDFTTSRLIAYSDFASSLVTVDIPTGNATVIGNTGFTRIADLALDTQTHTLYGLSTPDTLVSIDVNTGVGSTIGLVTPPGTTIEALAYDPMTDKLFAVDELTDRLVSIDKSTGALSVIGGVGFSQVTGLAFAPDSNQLFAVDRATHKLITIDKLTGVGSSIGSFGGADGYSDIHSITFGRLTAVPEPSSAVLICSIAIPFVAFWFKRRR